MPAEFVRDNALAVSGLLVREVGGASVKPYQPDGYYRHLNFPKRTYQQHNDERQWRRGLYVHWQRQYLHPMLKAFDAPSREECTAKRPRSNTPLASLVLLNDPTFVEAARKFAERVLLQSVWQNEPRLPHRGDAITSVQNVLNSVFGSCTRAIPICSASGSSRFLLCPGLAFQPLITSWMVTWPVPTFSAASLAL